MGRVAWLRACGVDLNQMMDEGILFPIRELNVKYKHSARFDDEYEVRTSMQAFNRAKMVFAYKVVDAKNGTVLVEGTTENVFTDKNGKTYYKELKPDGLLTFNEPNEETIVENKRINGKLAEIVKERYKQEIRQEDKKEDKRYDYNINPYER